ncbi:GNAT family N-acetyltransferase [Sphingomonas sp. ST-64]|uniref:GNAT family N-acetyltransferase n=1 Tax=Sphingomonas plantiphila TaxID=3163295 RepID=A0ABW8YLG2_9SPHN
MNNHGVDPAILKAWLSARSIARGLPLPIPDHGGFRVDTKSDTEIARWVFAKSNSGLEHLARSISDSRYFLKLCGAPGDLKSALPSGWKLHAPGFFMRRTVPSTPIGHLPFGYTIEVKRNGMVAEARIFEAAGALAASGYAAETNDVFVYDRIITEPGHRRRGLGRALMQTLHDARQNPSATELLVATEEGRTLYVALGWETISPYSTASLVRP